MKTLLAIVKFNPVAVALNESKRIIESFDYLKLLIIFSLLSVVIDPVIFKVEILFSVNIFSKNPIILIHYVNISIFYFLWIKSCAYFKTADNLELISII